MDNRGRDELVDLFVQRTVDYGAQIIRTTTPAVAIVRILQQENVTAVAVPRSFPRAWRPLLGELVEDDGLSSRDLDRIGAALTGCTLSIAETGTIVLASADGRRALTLLPDLHVCVVREVQVVATLPLAFAALDAVTRLEPLTFVSGPSATSNIELRRVEGVQWTTPPCGGHRPMIGVGVIGTGFGLPAVKPALERTGGARVVAVCGSSQTRAEELGAMHGIATRTNDPKKLAESEGVHLVVVASPNDLHLEHARTVLEAGKHLWLEKPVGLDAREARDLAALAAASDALMSSTIPCGSTLDPVDRIVLAGGAIGRPYFATVRQLSSALACPARPRTWQHEHARGGGVRLGDRLASTRPVSVSTQGGTLWPSLAPSTRCTSDRRRTRSSPPRSRTPAASSDTSWPLLRLTSSRRSTSRFTARRERSPSTSNAESFFTVADMPRASPAPALVRRFSTGSNSSRPASSTR